jgi:DNA-binding CsgD family transcriptional regulator
MTQWRQDHERLVQWDPSELGAGELQQLAAAAYMLGRYQESVDAWDRAHTLLLEQGDAAGACRCLFWLLLAIGEDDVSGAPRMGGHLARIHRLVEGFSLGELEQAYLQCYDCIDKFMSGRYDGSVDAWARIADIGRTHADDDIWAFGAQGHGRTLIRMGRVREGNAVLDELFVSIGLGAVSPMMTGWVYCSCLEACHEGFDVPRAIEWTRSAKRWAGEQGALETYTGVCLLHRSRIRRMLGSWDDALHDIDRACRKLSEGRIHFALGDAHYQRGEVLRLRGDHAGAEDGYRIASQHGHDPQPGLALLRLAQGKNLAAGSALRRALDETTDLCRRAGLLPARAEVALAEADVGAAELACGELEGLAETFDSRLLRAEALVLRGRIALAEGDPRTALEPLRRAARLWHDLESPLAGARTRVHLAAACEALGDTDGAEMERTSAREVFGAMGAQDDLAALRTDRQPRTPLSEREVEVVRKVAAGLSNRAVATQLHISEKTVASHLSHIFTKLDVPNRAAVTAYYYEELAGNR